MKIKNVTIVGGGSSGWMTAAAIAKLCPHIKLTVVESSKVSTVGVGESTLGHFNTYLRILGLKDEDWMADCNATYKNSIRFTNFNKKNGGSFEYPFIDGYDLSFAEGLGLYAWPMLHAKYPEEFDNKTFARFYALGNTLLAEHNREYRNEDSKLGANFIFKRDTAYHIDATLFGQWLKNNICIPNGVTVLDKTIHSYMKDNKGNITQILCDDGYKLNADLYIDCTGFRSILLENWMGEQFIPYEDKLSNDSAWACRIPYSDRQTQMHNVTDCRAMSNGWIWNIPLWNRIGTGYVYSSRFCSKEEALREFMKHIQDTNPNIDMDKLEPFHIDIRHGRRRRAWSNNVVGVGLSYSFVEPLESTGLLSTHENIIKLVDILNRRDGYVTQIERDSFNMSCTLQMNNFRDFVAAHYATSGRTDTPYWRYCTQTRIYDPEMYGDFIPKSDSLANTVTPLVHSREYNKDGQGGNFILAGMGISPISTSTYVDSFFEYDDINKLEIMRSNFAKNYEQVEKFVKTLPTHYEYLRDNIYGGVDEYAVQEK